MEPIKTQGKPEERKRKYVVMSGDLDYWGEEEINNFASRGDNLVVKKDEEKGTFEIVSGYTLKRYEVKAFWNKERVILVDAKDTKEAIEKACELADDAWTTENEEIVNMEAEEI